MNGLTSSQVLAAGVLVVPGSWRQSSGQEDFWSLHHCTVKTVRCLFRKWHVRRGSLPLVERGTELGSMDWGATRPAKLTTTMAAVMKECILIVVRLRT